MGYSLVPTAIQPPNPVNSDEAADLLASQGARLTTAEVGVATANGRTKLALYADFSEYPDGLPDGVVPEFAENPWVTSGSVAPRVASGKLSANGSGYLYTTIDPELFLIGFDISFGGSGGSSCSTLALTRTVSSGQLLYHFAHLIIGPNGSTLTIRKDGGDFENALSFSWDSPCKIDGTVYQFGLMRQGNVLTVIGPAGEAVSVNDFRVESVFSGNTGAAFWQANYSGATKAYIHKAWAFSEVISRYPNLDAILARVGLPSQMVTADPVRNGGITAGYGNASQVFIGPTSSGPAIQFGGVQKTTLGYLTSPINIGDTTFSADRVVLGTVQVGIGNDEETFSAVGYPTGTGPYVHTITAATKAHAAGDGVNGSSTAGQMIYQSLGNGFVYIPAQTCLVSGTWIGSDLTTRIDGASNQLSMASGDSFKCDGTWNGGHLILGTYHVWQDGAGKLYIKNGAPTSATDGTVIGTQT